MSWNAELTHFSQTGARGGVIPASWLLVICPQHWAVSPSAQKMVEPQQPFCLSTYMSRKKECFHIEHVWKVSKHWGEGWDANTLCLWFPDKPQRSHCRPYHNNLKWFSHNSQAADGSPTQSCEQDRVECFGNPGVVLALRYSNWLRALEWFGPTVPSGCSSPGIYTVSLGNLFSNLFPASV